MMNRPLMMSIAAVERDTGLSKDTLRVWERRYGFPVPVRDGQGERAYPLEQIERLRVIKRLLDVGHRPGRVVNLPMDDLMALAGRSADAQGLALKPARRRPVAVDTPPPGSSLDLTPLAPSPAMLTVWGLSGPTGASGEQAPQPGSHSPWLQAGLDRIDAHDQPGLRLHLSQTLVTLGLAHFITEVASPLLGALGEGWLRGRFQIAQEHWVSHLLQQVLQSAIHAMPAQARPRPPRVMLSTFPGESHAMGLLMSEAWLALLQAQPLNFGTQLPLWDLVQAATQYRVDVVGLSFTASSPVALVQDTLSEFRAKLPPHVAVWAGGRHPLLQRRAPAGVVVVDSMAELSRVVQAWRAQHPADSGH